MMPRRQKQKARIGPEIEWPLAQSEETFVHAYFHAFHAIAAAPTATPRSATPDAAITFQRNILRAEWLAHGLGEPFPGRLLEFWIEADSFMRHMVRALVGTMLEVAGGRRSMADFESLLEGAPRDRAGETAHAHGLYLASVRY